MEKADVVLINPGDRKQVYQSLGEDFAAIEPPFWIAVLASFLRSKGVEVVIIDANAENIPPEETARRAASFDPLLSCVVVYGSQPSASTQNMTVAGRICAALSDGTSSKVAIGGLHPSALPRQTIEEERVDFVVQGEGPDCLLVLVETLKKGSGDFTKVPGLWYRDNGVVHGNAPAPLISDLDAYLPVGAWDLLPMHLYRAHNWHCFDDITHRSPYGAIYTSLGCPYSCVFCCINAPFGKPGIRYRSPELVAKEIGVLVRTYGIKNIKFVDELYVLHEKHFMTIADLLIKEGYDLNIWAYARVDTVREHYLERLKRAGVNWLALGIESANPDVRDGASKRMKIRDIKGIVSQIQDAGIRVIGNYIFGLPDDTVATMQETLDLAIDLNCEFANFYCAMAYPGSKLYEIALAEKWELPPVWHAFSQHSYDMLPLPTKHIGPRDVMQFRDDAFHRYFENPRYLAMVEEKFGGEVRRHVEAMTATRLKRKLLGN